MASMKKDNKGKGAAEEPEPERDGASSTLAAASYDPTIYQRPHPDDRGRGGGGGGDGGDGKKGGATKIRGKAKAVPTEIKGGKGKDDRSHRCANCDKPGATSRCGRCGVEWYCDRNCQKVSRGGW